MTTKHLKLIKCAGEIVMQFFDKQLRLVLKDLRKSLLWNAFLTFSGLWTVLDASVYLFGLENTNKPALTIIFLILSLGMGLFKSLPKTSIYFTITNSDTRLNIYFGDLFKGNGIKVIPVNEFFDSEIGDHVSENSLHGMLILNQLNGKSANFDKLVQNALKSLQKTPLATIGRHSGKTKKYEIGTTLPIEVGANKFLLVALAHTDIQTKKASADIECLWKALGGLWKQARISANGNKVVVPLLGSGLAGVGLPVQQLLQIIIISIIKETHQKKITSEIDIVLHERLFDEISLRSIMGGKF